MAIKNISSVTLSAKAGNYQPYFDVTVIDDHGAAVPKRACARTFPGEQSNICYPLIDVGRSEPLALGPGDIYRYNISISDNFFIDHAGVYSIGVSNSPPSRPGFRINESDEIVYSNN